MRVTDSVPLPGSAVPEPASSSVSRESLVSALPTVPTPKPQAPELVGTSQTHPSSCIAVKPGKCPVDRLRCLSPTKHTCNKDLDCSGRKRCCVSACGRDCRDPSKGAIIDSPPPTPSSGLSFQVNNRSRIPSSEGRLPPPHGQSWRRRVQRLPLARQRNWVPQVSY